MSQSDLKGFHAVTREARSILVVDLAFLGDTVHLVPALWEIKRNHPQAALHVVSAPVGAEVLRLAPCVDQAWSVELDPARRTLGEQWRLVRALRRENFDVAFDFAGVDRATILTALSGARWRVGHAAGRRHFWNSWLVANWVPRQDPDLPVFEQRRQVLAACGYALDPPRFDLRVEESAARWAEGAVPKGAIHVSVNSAKPLKEWPLEHYMAMLKAVRRDHPDRHFVASGGPKPREQERLRQLETAMADSHLQLLPENLTIAQLAAALQRCRLHVGPDSGVIHLAMAMGVPTLSLIREQKEYKAWMPHGAAHRALTVPCACRDACTVAGGGTERAACLAGIAPELVAKQVCRHLETGAFPET
jgi:ADP-heptose:LPS heptosyltransferase